MRNRPFWRSKWVVIGWLGSLVLVALSIFTPVELVPLPLENVPRWGLYALALPACSLLQTRWPRARLLWQTLPWLGWGPLLTVLFFWLPTTVAQTPAKPWADILAPFTWVITRPQEWRTTHVLFRRGRQLVVQQRYVCWDQPLPRVPVRGSWRTALVTPLLPGVQWAAPLPGPGSLDASWQAQEPADATDFECLLLWQVQLEWRLRFAPTFTRAVTQLDGAMAQAPRVVSSESLAHAGNRLTLSEPTYSACELTGSHSYTRLISAMQQGAVAVAEVDAWPAVP